MSMPTTNPVSSRPVIRPILAAVSSTQSSITVEQVDSRLNANSDYSEFSKLPANVQSLINGYLDQIGFPIFSGWYRILIKEANRIFAGPASNEVKKGQVIRMLQFLALMAFGVKHGAISKESLKSLFSDLFETKKKDAASGQLEAVYNKVIRFFKYQAHLTANFKNCAFDMSVVDEVSQGTIDKSQKIYLNEETHIFAYLKKIRVQTPEHIFTAKQSSSFFPPRINFLRQWIANNLPEENVRGILSGMLRNNNLGKLLNNEDGAFNVIKTMLEEKNHKKFEAVLKIISTPIYDPVVAEAGNLLSLIRVKDNNKKYFRQFGSDDHGLWNTAFQKAYTRFLKDHAPGLKLYFITKQHLEKLYAIAKAQAESEVNASKAFLQKYSPAWQTEHVGNFTRFRGTYDFVKCIGDLRNCGNKINNLLNLRPVNSLKPEETIILLSLLKEFSQLRRVFLEHNFALLVPKKVLVVVYSSDGSLLGTVRKTDQIELNWENIKHLFVQAELSFFLTFKPGIQSSVIDKLSIPPDLKQNLKQSLGLRNSGKFDEIKRMLGQVPIEIQVQNVTIEEIAQWANADSDTYQSKLYATKTANLLAQVIVQPDGSMSILLKKKWNGEKFEKIASLNVPFVGKDWSVLNKFNEMFMHALKIPYEQMQFASTVLNEKVGLKVDGKLVCTDCTNLYLPRFYKTLEIIRTGLPSHFLTETIFKQPGLVPTLTFQPYKVPPKLMPWGIGTGVAGFALLAPTIIFAAMAANNSAQLRGTRDYGTAVNEYYAQVQNQNIAIGFGIGAVVAFGAFATLLPLSLKKAPIPMPEIRYNSSNGNTQPLVQFFKSKQGDD